MQEKEKVLANNGFLARGEARIEKVLDF